MTINEFLSEMEDVLQTEETLTPETVLRDLDDWDSLAIMSTMAFLQKKFNKVTTFKDYHNIVTMQDIIHLAGI